MNQSIKISLYIGGGDTVSNTIRWLLLIIAKHPEWQEKCFAELSSVANNNNGHFEQINCPFTCAVLLESRRLNPVADTGLTPLDFAYFGPVQISTFYVVNPHL